MFWEGRGDGVFQGTIQAPPGGTEIYHENSNYNTRYLERDSNRMLSECKSDASPSWASLFGIIVCYYNIGPHVRIFEMQHR
jgi:hypothetical protein